METREDWQKSYIHENPEPKTKPPKSRTMQREGKPIVLKSFAELKELLNDQDKR